MKINHNNRDVDIDVSDQSCWNCCFHNSSSQLCRRVQLCVIGNYIYKSSTKNSSIFEI